MTPRTVVLGLGNVLLGDDGIGVWVADALSRRWSFPAGVTVLEGGTLGLDLLPSLDGVERLLLIDAVRLGLAPGALVRLEGCAVPAALDHKLSPHQVSVGDLLGAARLLGKEPPRVVLHGIEAACLDPGTGFSPPVAGALPRLEAAALDELRRWGVAARPVRDVVPPPVWWDGPGIARRS